MYELPKTVTVGGDTFAIRNGGDYRTILDICELLEDEELTKDERIIAAICVFYDVIEEFNDTVLLPDLQEAVTKLFEFLNCGQEKSPGVHHDYKLIDWKQDAHLICSAINNVAQKEIRDIEYMHWWTFMGHYIAIGDCPLSNIVGIRSKIVRGEKLEKHERKFRRENPEYFTWNSKTVEQKEAEAWVNSVWNNSAWNNGDNG